MLPLGGKPLSFWSIEDARRIGIDTVVSTDIPELTQYAMNTGCASVRQITDGSMTHAEVIRDAMKQSGRAGRPCILLQPTSPIRLGGIINKCWIEFSKHNFEKTVFTSSVVHVSELEDGELKNREKSSTLWDGNVAIFPANRECDFSQCVPVRNLPCNSIQIDTEEDYVMACATFEMSHQIKRSIHPSAAGMIAGVLSQFGIPAGSTIAVVGRKGEIPEGIPVFHVNHCRGYDGGRVDGLFVIANPAIVSQGINSELREAAAKAKIVIVRDNGNLDWLMKSLPEIVGKTLPLRACLDGLDDHLTSGAILCDLLSMCGHRPQLIGAYKPSEIESALVAFHKPAMSREISLLWASGSI